MGMQTLCPTPIHPTMVYAIATDIAIARGVHNKIRGAPNRMAARADGVLIYDMIFEDCEENPEHRNAYFYPYGFLEATPRQDCLASSAHSCDPREMTHHKHTKNTHTHKNHNTRSKAKY